MEYFALAIGAIFVNNIILSQFLGMCPFLGVSKEKSSALSMGLAVTLVITLTTTITYFIYTLLLEPNDLTGYSTIVFILVIAAAVQLLEMVIKKFLPSVFNALGVYLPLITTNCAVLGVAIDVSQNASKAGVEGMGYPGVLTYAVATSIGYAIVIFFFAAIREEIESYDVPKSFKGMGVGLISAFIMAMAFMGFSGLV